MTINWTLVTDILLKETAKGWENTGIAGVFSGEAKLLLNCLTRERRIMFARYQKALV